MSSLGSPTSSDNQDPEVPDNGQASDNILLMLSQGSDNSVSEVETLRQALRAALERVRILEEGHVDLRNESYLHCLYGDQQHVLAISAVCQERDSLQKTNLALRRRIEPLTAQVLEQNLALQRASTLALNHDAVLIQLAKAEVEVRAVSEHRDATYRELEDAREQGRRLDEKHMQLKERMTDLEKNAVLVKRHLEEEVIFWKQRYELELERCLGNEDMPETNLQQHGIAQESNSPAVAEQPPGEYIDGESAAAPTERCDRRLATEPPHSRAGSVSPVAKKPRFEVGRSALPQCKNCRMIFDVAMPASGPCRFHLAPPQPLKSWRKAGDGTVYHEPKRKTEFYWACCEKSGVQEPPGCRNLRHHDVILPFEQEE